MGSREDEGAHDDVGVAIDIFGEGVHDDVGAEQKRGGVEGGEEGVVDEHDRSGAMGASNAGDTRDVNEAECWVCWRFYPYKLWGLCQSEG